MNKLILGTAQFGMNYGINNDKGMPQEIEVMEILDLAMDSGVNMLDTAHEYGHAEELIGRYHASRGETFRIISKFARIGRGLNEVIDEFHAGLQCMGISSYHAYHFHRFEDILLGDDLIDHFFELKRNGKMEYLGVSVYDNEEFSQAIDLPYIDIIQIPYNLLDNHAQKGLLIRRAKQSGKIIHSRSVFLQGLFFMNPEKVPESLSPLKQLLIDLQYLAGIEHLDMESLALGYALANSYIDGVLIGVDSTDQLKKNVAASYTQISEKLKKTIDEVKVEDTRLLLPVNWS